MGHYRIVLGFAGLAMLGGVVASVEAIAAAQKEQVHEETTYGTLKYGQTDSAIGKAGFITRSAIGDRIFKVCKMDDFCMLRAKIENKNDFVRQVIAIEKSPKFSDPDLMIKYIYKQVDKNAFNVDDDDLDLIFTKSLAELIRKARVNARKEETDVLDTPWFFSQEGKPVNVKISTTSTGSSTAISRVQFTNSDDSEDKLNRHNFELVKIDGQWKISDAKLPLMSNEKLDSYIEFLVKKNK
ncbi:MULTISPECIES: hypothetical protein [unclassified Methylobacterium]|uniref:hypothetical protein n=1 Tax=unclassified Methylobacterium TaxID=2615210 RepID=UPI00226AE76B|nr:MULTISPECIES: hypothetical protein [unclassified Methylobacterium]